MKTAEEWCNSLNGDHAQDAYVTVGNIREIQLDAYRAGGLAAAEMIPSYKQYYRMEIQQSILTHFNNPKLEIPE